MLTLLNPLIPGNCSLVSSDWPLPAGDFHSNREPLQAASCFAHETPSQPSLGISHETWRATQFYPWDIGLVPFKEVLCTQNSLELVPALNVSPVPSSCDVTNNSVTRNLITLGRGEPGANRK